MSGTVIVLRPAGARIPASLSDLTSFRAWTRSEEFPEAGRIDWIAGEVEVDVSPESFNTHATPKMAIARDLSSMVDQAEVGVTVTDSTRYACMEADLSAEPDVVVLLFSSLEAGRVRLIPRASAGTEDFIEVEGAADLVVEVVSDASVEKDTQKLPARYHAAGVREYWLVDARGEEVHFTLNRLEPAGYVAVAPAPDGFRRSEVLGRAVRLVRLAPRAGVVRYRLESRG